MIDTGAGLRVRRRLLLVLLVCIALPLVGGCSSDPECIAAPFLPECFEDDDEEEKTDDTATQTRVRVNTRADDIDTTRVAAGHIRRVTDAENDVTVFTVVGAVDAAEVSGHIMAFLTGDPTQLVLWDIRAGSVAGLSIVDGRWIIERAKLFADRGRGGRTAIVCAQTLDYAVSCMFQAFAEAMQIPFEIAMFRDHAEARRWLNELRGGEGADSRPHPRAVS
jgi:hypothetical protein